jgi:hypothetical protein
LERLLQFPFYHSLSKEEIEADMNHVLLQQDEIRQGQSPQGSTEEYCQSPNAFEFLGGYTHKQDKASRPKYTTISMLHSNKDDTKPNEEDSITGSNGNIVVCMPLGLLRVRTKNGKPLPPAYREMAERISKFLNSNEQNPSPKDAEYVRQVYNRLPSEDKR